MTDEKQTERVRINRVVDTQTLRRINDEVTAMWQLVDAAFRPDSLIELMQNEDPEQCLEALREAIDARFTDLVEIFRNLRAVQ